MKEMEIKNKVFYVKFFRIVYVLLSKNPFDQLIVNILDEFVGLFSYILTAEEIIKIIIGEIE